MSIKSLLKEINKNKNIKILQSYIYEFDRNLNLAKTIYTLEDFIILDYDLLLIESDNFPMDLYIYSVRHFNIEGIEEKSIFILFDEFNKSFTFAPDFVSLNKIVVKLQNHSYCSLLLIKGHNIPIYYLIYSSMDIFRISNKKEENLCPFCNAKFDLVCKNCNINHIEILLKDLEQHDILEKGK